MTLLSRNLSARGLALLAGTLLSLGAQAQSTASADSVKFGTRAEYATDSITVYVKNTTTAPVTLARAKLFTFYRSTPFSTIDTNKVIPVGDSVAVKLKFSPAHNMSHKTVVWLYDNGSLGVTPLVLTGNCVYSNNYYSTTYNLTENALKTALKARITQGYTTLGYNTARDRMFMDIDNKRVNGQNASVNTVECIYTAKVATGYASRTAAQNQGFNTEHTFPQGFFNSSDPMVSDLHHLFPTNDAANNSRGNQAFGIATMPYTAVTTNQPSRNGANGLYEPRDEQKGATARAMLYFVTRHTDYSGFCAPQEPTLRLWSRNFPPTAVDKRRNADVFRFQGNRNPFVDYPEFLDRITSVSTTNGGFAAARIETSESQINFGVQPAGSAKTYRWALYNAGTAACTLTSATVTGDPAFALVNGLSGNLVLAPGETRSFLVSYTNTSTTGVQGNLNLTLTGVNPTSIVVPINARTTTSLATNARALRMPTLAPNPAVGFTSFTSADFAGQQGRVVLYTAQGQEINNTTLVFDGQGRADLNIQNLPKGAYMALLSINGLSQRYTLVVQ